MKHLSMLTLCGLVKVRKCLSFEGFVQPKTLCSSSVSAAMLILAVSQDSKFSCFALPGMARRGVGFSSALQDRSCDQTPAIQLPAAMPSDPIETEWIAIDN